MAACIRWPWLLTGGNVWSWRRYTFGAPSPGLQPSWTPSTSPDEWCHLQPLLTISSCLGCSPCTPTDIRGCWPFLFQDHLMCPFPYEALFPPRGQLTTSPLCHLNAVLPNPPWTLYCNVSLSVLLHFFRRMPSSNAKRRARYTEST